MVRGGHSNTCKGRKMWKRVLEYGEGCDMIEVRVEDQRLGRWRLRGI